MSIFNWLGILLMAAPVFFIIKTSIGMIKDKRIN